MQNRCNCGCQGFVPVRGNWDFDMDSRCGSCQQGNARRNRANACGECEAVYTRERENEDCQCERCDDSREAECCGRNTYIRDMDECECESNTPRNRTNGNCGCDECESAHTRNRSSGNCSCGKDDGYSRKNRHVGMVSVEMQEIDEIFESESGLRAGTLFPELHKPLNGYCPCDDNCATCAQETAFAAWELRLYLNTHPHDKEALALFRKLCKEAEEENYATTFLTDDCCAHSWSWVENPWPWEYDCQCGD